MDYWFYILGLIIKYNNNLLILISIKSLKYTFTAVGAFDKVTNVPAAS